MRKTLLGMGFVVAGLAALLMAQESTNKPVAPSGQKVDGALNPDTARLQGSPQNADEEPMANASPDQKFVSCSTHTNLFEIELSKMVASKATDEQVKKIAQQMVDGHTKAQDQLKEAAQKQNLKVPEKLVAWQQAKLDFVSKMPAEDLQREYSFGLVAGHYMAILQTQHALGKIENADLKQLAQTQLKELRSHLQRANALAMQFTGGQGSITGEPVSPDSAADQNKADPNKPSDQSK